MSYFHQQKYWGLGNLIMATPMLQLASQKTKKPIDCYFDNDQLASLFSDSSFMRIIEKKPSVPPKYGSSRCPPNKRKSYESDSEALCRLFLKHSGPIPNTYIDRPNKNEYLLERDSRKYIAVFHGCLGKAWLAKKDIGAKNRQMVLESILNRGMVPVILGSLSDKKSFWINNNLNGCLDFIDKLSLRKSIAVLSQCDAFISNDTGLYHAAGALKMRGAVIWYKTNHVKNRSTCKNIDHIISKKMDSKIYKDSVNKFLDEL